MTSFVCLDTVSFDDSDYLFARCYFDFDGVIVGDPDALMVAGSLTLALEAVLSNRDSRQIISCPRDELEDIFSSYEQDKLTNNVLPTGIESFDNNQGLFFHVDNRELLVVRKPDERKLALIPISAKTYFQELADSHAQLTFDGKQ